MAQDQVEVMGHLGFEASSSVAGHDRGARTAFRMALDHPERVLQVREHRHHSHAHVLTHVRMSWARRLVPLVLHRAALRFPRAAPRRQRGVLHPQEVRAGQGKGEISDETMKEYLRCCTPEQIHGVCEDYRAASTMDFEMDTADFEAGRKIDCPALG